MVEAATGGALNYKTPEEAWELFEIIANNDYQRNGERAVVKTGYLELIQ